MKGYLAVLDVEDAIVGDGYAVGIAAHVVQDLLRSGKGLLGVDDPVPAADSSQEAVTGGSVSQFFERTGRKNSLRHGIQRLPSGESPPPGTTQCR